MKRFVSQLMLILMLLTVSASAEKDDTINILLLGTDNLGEVTITESEEMSRADAIFIVTIQPKSRSIKLMSIERDYLVELPDNYGVNKLGVSSYFGGPQLAMKTINQFFQLDISHYAHIDIENIIKAIDIMDGIDIQVYEEEVDEVNSFIEGIMVYEGLSKVKAGMNHLIGPQAWAFLGVRNNDADAIDSNAARNDRQQRVFKACIEKVFNMDVSEIIQLISDLIPLINTNLSMADILNLMNAALASDLDQIEYFRTPNTPYEMKRVDMHRGLIVTDMQKEIDGIHSFLYD